MSLPDNAESTEGTPRGNRGVKDDEDLAMWAPAARPLSGKKWRALCLLLEGRQQQEVAAEVRVAIGYWDGAVCDITPGGVVRTMRYAIDLLGEDHVALGSDYDGSTSVLFDTSELAILTDTMLDQDFTEPEIIKIMGGNSIRFLQQYLPES